MKAPQINGRELAALLATPRQDPPRLWALMQQMAEIAVSGLRPPAGVRGDIIHETLTAMMESVDAGKITPRGKDAFSYVFQIARRQASKTLEKAADLRRRHRPLTAALAMDARVTHQHHVPKPICKAHILKLTDHFIRKARRSAVGADGQEEVAYSRGILDGLTAYRRMLGENYYPERAPRCRRHVSSITAHPG